MLPARFGGRVEREEPFEIRCVAVCPALPELALMPLYKLRILLLVIAAIACGYVPALNDVHPIFAITSTARSWFASA